MSDAQVLYAEGKAVTANSTTWVDVATIAAGSFTAGAKYLIVASVLVRSTSSSEDTRLRLVHGTTPTVFTDGSASYELFANVQETNIGWMYLYTQPGTAELVKIQVSTSSTATVTVELGQIFAINLDDVGTEDTDYRHNEVTADYTSTSSFVAQASETWTPNGTDDYLVIAHGVISGVTTTTSHGMRINDSVAGALQAIDVEGEDATNDIRSYLLMAAYTPSNASHTISADFKHTTNAVTVRSSRIFVLNLNKFAQHAYSYAAAEDAPAAAPNWTTTRTVAPTPSSTGNWLYWGSYNFDAATTGTDDVATRLQVNASGGGLVSDPDYTDSSPGMDSWDSTDVMPFNIFNLVSLSSGAARDINLDVKAVAASAARVENRCLVAFSVALATGDQTITASAIASAEAFGTDQLGFTLLPSALASAEAFGTALIKLDLLMAAITSAEAFGTTVLTPGEVSVAPSAISSLESFGTAKIDLTLLLSAIASAETFGAPTITLTITPSGLASAEVFGTAQIDLALFLSGIAGLEAFGDAVVSQAGAQVLLPNAISSLEAFGTHRLDLTLLLSGIASAEAFGDGALSLYLLPSGVASVETFGTPQIDMLVLPSGLVSGEAFGDAVVSTGLLITPASIASVESFGTPQINLLVLPSGLATSEAFGDAVVSTGLVITAVAIASAEVFGTTIVLWFATPADRVIVVPIDERRIEVERESRVLAMAADDRTHEVN